MNLGVNLLSWSPVVFLWTVFIVAAVSYSLEKTFKILNFRLGFKLLAISVLIFRFVYAIIESVAQYYVWSRGDEIGKALINSPLSDAVPLSNFLQNNFGAILQSKWGYFLFYSWGRFWINVLLLSLVALCFYAILVILKKYNERFFKEGETYLGLLLCLIVGWPNLILFVPITFVFVVLVSIFRLLYYKEPYTTLGMPMLLASLVIMLFGGYFINTLGLAVLII